MSSFDKPEMRLVESSLIVTGHRISDRFNYENALADLSKHVTEASILPAIEGPDQAHIRALLRHNASELITTFKTTLASDGSGERIFLNTMFEAAHALFLLRYTTDEIFDRLASVTRNAIYRIKEIGDPMRNFFVWVSSAMKYHEYTLNEALINVATSSRPEYFRSITLEEAKSFLSPEAVIGLYMHARVKYIMGLEDYQNSDTAYMSYLRKIGEFHSAHQERIYLATDYAMNAQGLPIEKCYELLQQNANATAINLLNKKVRLMPQVVHTLQDLMAGPLGLNYTDAKKLTFDMPEIVDVLTDNDFEELLAPQNRTQLTGPTIYNQFQSSVVNSSSSSSSSSTSNAMQSTANFTYPTSLGTLAIGLTLNELIPNSRLVVNSQEEDSDSQLMQGIAILICFMLLVAFNRQRIMNSVSLLKSRGAKVMGFLTAPKNDAEPTIEQEQDNLEAGDEAKEENGHSRKLR